MGIPYGATRRRARRSATNSSGEQGQAEGEGEKDASGKLKFITPGSPSYKEHPHPQTVATGPNTGLTARAATVDGSAPPDQTQRSKPLTEPRTPPPWLRGPDGHGLTEDRQPTQTGVGERPAAEKAPQRPAARREAVGRRRGRPLRLG